MFQLPVPVAGNTERTLKKRIIAALSRARTEIVSFYIIINRKGDVFLKKILSRVVK